jgi:hypothetical protein
MRLGGWALHDYDGIAFSPDKEENLVSTKRGCGYPEVIKGALTSY